jgi:IclR family acetate operon transcriptional repressor
MERFKGLHVRTQNLPDKSAMKRARIQSLTRADAMLGVLADSPKAACTLTEIANAVSLNKTTTFNILATLVSLGFMDFDEASKIYRLGSRNLELGRRVQASIDIAELAKPALLRLCSRSRETVNLGIPCRYEVLVSNSIEGTHGVRVASYIGSRNAYHSSALGKAILSHYSAPMRQLIYSEKPLAAMTPNTITDVEKLEKELQKVRRLGYSLDLEENEKEAVCVAAPVFDGFGTVAGAISITGPASRLNVKKLEALAQDVMLEAKALSSAYRSSD